MLDRRRDVEPSVGIETEAVASAPTELLDHPLAGAVGKQPLEAAPFDDDEVAVAVERDAVAVEEAVGDDARAAVALEREHPTGVLFLRRPVARIGEVHGSVGGDAEIVGAVEALVEEVGHGSVGGRQLQARCDRTRRHRRRAVDDSGGAEVEPAVLGDEDRPVGRERGAVGATTRLREALGDTGLRTDAEQRARGHAGDHERAVGAPHRPLTERHPGGNGLGLHRRAP